MLVSAAVASPFPAVATANPQPPSLEDLYATVESGVWSIAASTCGGTGSGSAFLLSPTEAVTAAHVVDGAVSLALVDDEMTVAAQVLGIDRSRDVALLQLDRPLTGYNFSIAFTEPDPGQTVVAIGFPLQQGKSITTGTVAGLDRRLQDPQGAVVSDLIQADVAVSPGNSGGPLLDEFGDVVGVVVGALNNPDAQGLNYAASAIGALPTIDRWRQNSTPVPLSASCDLPLGPAGTGTIISAPAPSDPLRSSVVTTFDLYFTAVNIGDYRTAWLLSLPAQRYSLGEWAAAMSTSFVLGVVIHEIVPTAEGARAWVTFTSLQMPHLGPRDGESCTMWSIDYRLVPASNLMLLAGGDGHNGPISRPC